MREVWQGAAGLSRLVGQIVVSPGGMRIAHFSDPHLLSMDGVRLRDFLNKRWLGGVNLIANRARDHKTEVFEALVADINQQHIDHVVCTGDVTNVALPAEFSFARGHFEQFVHGPEDLTVIPGNHDAYIGAGVDLFADHFGPFCRPDPEWAWETGDLWPVVRVRGPLAVIALTTGHPTPWFQAWGRAGRGQLERLEQVLTDSRLRGKFRLVAIHHPPAGRYASKRRHGLRDWREFAAVIGRAGAELVIHGHEHQDLRNELAGPQGPVPVHGIQSATYAGGRESHRARYRVYTLDVRESGATVAGAEAELRGFDAASHSFETESKVPPWASHTAVAI